MRSDYIMTSDYLKQKLENAVGEVRILGDNIQHLKARPDLFERIEELAWSLESLLDQVDPNRSRDE